MIIKNTKFEDSFLIKTVQHSDDRGYFFESYQSEKYSEFINSSFVQDNISCSRKNVLRGLHLQQKKPQGKLVTVFSGEIFDVIVDLRINSSTFLEHESFYLDSKNYNQLWIPEGFAHGFLALSETVLFGYKCSSFYDHADEVCIKYDDSRLNIKWPKSSKLIVSEKDMMGISLSEYINVYL